MISFKSKVTQAILNYYFTNPHSKQYIRGLARILDLDPKNVDRKLKELEMDGLLVSDFEGKQRYFSLARNSPFLENYRSLFISQYGIQHILKQALKDVPGLKRVYIFGSYANGKFDHASDIDILAVGGHKVMDVQRAILPIQKQIGREINTINMSQEELVAKKKQHNPLVRNIFSSKIIQVL